MLTAIIFLITIWFLFGCTLTYAIMTTLLTVEWIILVMLGILLISSTLGWIFYLLDRNCFIKLPCPIGTTVYALINLPLMEDDFKDVKVIETKFTLDLIDEFNESVFLTKDKALKRLEELQNER